MYILLVQDGLKDKNPDATAFSSLTAAKKSAEDDWNSNAGLTFTILNQDSEGSMTEVAHASQVNPSLNWIE